MALTVFAALVPVQTHYGGGQHIQFVTNPSDIVQWGRAFFVAEIMYLLTIWAVKTSIAALLLRLGLSRKFNLALYGVIGVSSILTLFFILWLTLQCKPIAYQFDKSIVGGTCVSLNTYVISVYVLSAINAVTDLVTGVIPVIVVYNLHLERRKKIMTSFTLAVGSL